ncbi:MAG TPA: hypothetical protein VIM94_05365 [Salegentibacter sp.]|uniref:hypothetical protein n=1 Tax=Salegentibacter sp. TaxID=1903072 RepID=UPI002F922FE3
MEKDDQNIKPRTHKEENKDEESKKESSFREFVGRIGYSVWITVMVIGGILAFLASLLLL